MSLYDLFNQPAKIVPNFVCKYQQKRIPINTEEESYTSMNHH